MPPHGRDQSESRKQVLFVVETPADLCLDADKCRRNAPHLHVDSEASSPAVMEASVPGN